MSAYTVIRDRGVALLSLDLPGEPVNKLTPDVILEFEELFFGRLQPDPRTPSRRRPRRFRSWRPWWTRSWPWWTRRTRWTSWR